MKNVPLVSIISPCYNGEKYLDDFLKSILNQNYSNIEFIFVDDGSIDRTKEIFTSYADAFKQRDIQAIYIYQENKGQAAAMNNALKIFKGDYMMWVDSDDILYGENVSEKVAFLENNKKYGFMLAQGEYVNANDINKRIRILRRIHDNEPDNLFEDYIYEHGVIYGPGTVMVRTSALLNVLPDREIYESREGQNLQIMLPLSYNYECGYLDKVLFKCVVHQDSHSHKSISYTRLINWQREYENLLQITINKIPNMSSEEKKQWINVALIKHHKDMLRFAYEYEEIKDIKLIKNELIGFGYSWKIEDEYLYYKIRLVYRKIRGLAKRIIRK